MRNMINISFVKYKYIGGRVQITIFWWKRKLVEKKSII